MRYNLHFIICVRGLYSLWHVCRKIFKMRMIDSSKLSVRLEKLEENRMEIF